jgi:DNA primase catalytic core
MIPQSTIDAILSAIRIEDIIGETVKLKKRGSVLIGSCPFHNEKSGSFTVSPHKGFYHCYGCHEGGNAISFVMRDKAMQFPEAIRFLAGKVKIKIEEEKSDPEAEAKAAMREQLFKVNEYAAKFYQKQLLLFPNVTAYASERFGSENISLWKLGFAPDAWTTFYDYARAGGYKEEFLLSSGLVKRSEKNHKVFDFFRNRLMFPIFDKAGQISGFSARQLTKDDTAKYINSPESDIYHKSRQLYGIHLAARAIYTEGATLVEGNPDVIRMHQVGAAGTVAPCGTAVSVDQLRILRKLTDTITIITDNDTAGQKSMLRTGKLAIEENFKVYCAVLPEGEDPDSFFQDETQYQQWIDENRQNFILMFAGKLLDKVAQDPARKNEAIKELCGHIQRYDDLTRKLYIDQICISHKIKARLFTDRLKDLDQSKVEIEPDESLPAGIDAKEYDRWGFYEFRNTYFMRSKSGREEISNFVMKPAFHIEGQDSRRVYELINFRGYRIVVDLDMQEMTSIQAFRRNVEGRGNFIFSGTDAQFTRIKSKLYEQTRTCSEIRVLGWQKEGFWAWSNGITTDTGFTEIDEHGIIEYNKKNFFIPAFSSIHIDDKSVFIAERKFLFKDRKVVLSEYTSLFHKVYGDNAMIGLCFWIATVFRDRVIYHNNNFPILNLFGPKGTGKSQMAVSLTCLFGEPQTPFNIHNGTKPGLAEHMQQFRNSFSLVDEYKNNLDYDKIETLKSIYDSVGRNRLNVDKRKETTSVNSAMILLGQEMPTADVALFSRLVFLQFHKTEYSEIEKKQYDKLKSLERDGLGHFTALLIAFRSVFEKEFWPNVESVISDIFDELREDSIEDRILRSWCTVGAALRTLQNKIDFGFGYGDIRPILIRGIRQQNAQVAKSNEIGQFWDLMEAMYDEGTLIENWHFRVNWLDKLKTSTGDRSFNEPIYVLRFKFSSICKFYSEHARRSGLKPLPADTLSYYLKNSKPFLGISSSVKFFKKEYKSEEGKVVEEKTITSAYCFDYAKIGVNLTRGFVGEIMDKQREAEADENDSLRNYKGNQHITPGTPEAAFLEQVSQPVVNVLGQKDLPF